MWSEYKANICLGLRGNRGGLAHSNPYLIPDDGHHEQKIDSKRPEDQEFRTFEVSPGDKVFLCPSELIVFERR